MNAELAQAAQIIADAVRESLTPPEHLWLTPEEAARHMGYSLHYFRNTLQHLPGFPKPARPTGGEGRWNKKEITDWMSRTRLRGEK